LVHMSGIFLPDICFKLNHCLNLNACASDCQWQQSLDRKGIY
jgi:hypothetical protein